MLGLKQLPEPFLHWNRLHDAPFGRRLAPWARRVIPWPLQLKFSGPFGVQPNSNTRILEYPWAFYATPLAKGMRVLELGGGLSGFQFVLDQHGCAVVNVDPGLDAKGVGWRCDTESIAKLNRAFGTSVELCNTVIGNAGLAPSSFDRVFSISVLEHLPVDEIREALELAYDCLKPGGLFVMTVDLFLNVAPFASRETNRYGTNINIRTLVEVAPFELVQGLRAELYGFREFDPDRVLSNLETYFLGDYPALVQCLVLRKPQQPVNRH